MRTGIEASSRTGEGGADYHAANHCDDADASPKWQQSGGGHQKCDHRRRLNGHRALESHLARPLIPIGFDPFNWKDRLIQLTYQTHVGFVYDLAGFRVQRQFEYPGEGWALTQDGKRILMSDGTPEIRFWDPETLRETGRITVTNQGQPLKNVNELEWVTGEIYANVWLTDLMLRIDPSSGAVVGIADLSGLLSRSDYKEGDIDVLNGIAYDAQGGRLFVTGKRWPKVFEIRLVKR